MSLQQKLQKIATEKNFPCVTISLNTHYTYPDIQKDEILLKNLLNEAEKRVINEFDTREVVQLLKNIEKVGVGIDPKYSLNSLHIFLSNFTMEVVRSPWPTSNEGVHISDTFAIRSLIKTHNRSENYLIMLLTQSGVQLYEAINDSIIEEITYDDFPFLENTHPNTIANKISDTKYIDNLMKEFFNKVDKSLVRVHNKTELKCLVIATQDNWNILQQVADKPDVYLGYVTIDHNDIKNPEIIEKSWEFVKQQQKTRRTDAINEMHEAVASGKTLTDLQEIYQAAIDGRGETLIVHQDFSQAVMMKDERTFDLIDDVTIENAIDDITSNIAWEVLSKKGSVYFTSQEEIKDLGKIVLKTRY